MVYQFAGQGSGANYGNTDGIDEMSDKHKISLFDDSRYEDSTIPNNYGSIPMGPLDEYNNSVSKQKRKRNNNNKRGKILTSGNKEHGTDSLYDEQLLNELNKHNDDDVILEEYRDSMQP